MEKMNINLINNLKKFGVYFVKQDRRMGKQVLLRNYLFVFYFDENTDTIKKLSCFDFLPRLENETNNDYKERFLKGPTPPFIKFTKNDDFFSINYDVYQEKGFEKLKNDILVYLNVPYTEFLDFKYSVL